MSGFNTINFIIYTTMPIMQNQNGNSAAKSFNNMGNQNIAGNIQGGVINNGQNAVQNNITTGLNTFTGLSAESKISPLTNDNQLMISTVEVEQRADYIKDLLNLPRDFETLIKQIEGGINNTNAKALKDLTKLLVGGKINLNMLAGILTENSKSAVNKIMQTIMMVSKMGSNDVNQLKELMKLFTAASASSETVQIVKSLIMLYLPWLPLSVRNEMNLNFTIDIFDKIDGEDPNSEEASEIIKIMIQTANYGNVMATVELAMNKEIDIFISAIESFPEDKVMSEFKKENKKSDIRSNLTIEKNKDPESSEKLKQNLKITASGYVSPKLILAAHSLIKIIIEIDNKDFIINKDNEG